IAVMGPDVRWVGNERGRARETEWSVVPNANLDPALIAAESQHELIMPPTRVTMGRDLGSRELIRDANTLVWYPAESDVSIRPSWFYTASDDGQTKTPEQLLELYFTSVGRNSNLLLNVPPNKEGRIGDEEVKSLLGFARLREELFSRNLLEDASVKIKSVCPSRARMVCDGDYETGVCLNKGKLIAWEWKNPVTFSVLLIQEDIRRGQRVESFSLEYLAEDGSWQKAAEGSTIGYKRLLRFAPVTTTAARLVIHSSRLEPFIAETGLY
ncbi:MAG: alpha-L-fucosidase, partial [Candidatus Cryptobacteroides sp.]